MRCNPDTVDLLYTALRPPQPESWEAGDPRTWLRDGRPLSPAQVQQVRQATAADWDGLDLLLSVDGYLLTVTRNHVAARLRAAGLPCNLPVVGG